MQLVLVIITVISFTNALVERIKPLLSSGRFASELGSYGYKDQGVQTQPKLDIMHSQDQLDVVSTGMPSAEMAYAGDKDANDENGADDKDSADNGICSCV